MKAPDRLAVIVLLVVAVVSAGWADEKSKPATQPATSASRENRPDSPSSSSPLPHATREAGSEYDHYLSYSGLCTPKNHIWYFGSRAKESKPMRVKFAIMAFGEQCECAFACLVSETHDTANIFVNDFSQGGGGGAKITDAQAARIDKIIANLPPEPPQAPMDRQVLVSVSQGDQWKIHVYDCGNLPAAILELSRLVGVRIGTRVVTIEPKSELDTIRANGWNENGMSLSPDGRTLVSGGANNVLKDWDAQSLKPVDTFARTPKLETEALAFSPDGKYLAVAQWGSIVVLNAKTGATVTTLTLPKNVLLRVVSFTPDSKFLIAYRYELFLYRVSDWKAVPQLPDVPQGIVRYFQSRDGKWAILGEADGKMLLWDLAAKKAKATLDTGHYPSFVEFSPDQTQVAVASTTTPPRDYDKANGECRIRVWDVKTARLVCELKPYDLTGPENIEGLLWCPDGKYVLAATKPGGSDSREVGVWNVATGRHRGDFTGALHLTGMALTPDGKTLIAGSKDNKIHLWDFVAGMKRIRAYEATLPALPQGQGGGQ